VAALILIGALLWIMLGAVLNPITDELNEMAADDEASAQTVATFGLGLAMFSGSVVIVLFVALYFGIIRALERRNQDGGFG